MSVSTTALADTLPSSIPKLDPAGTNWTIFLFRFQDAVDAKGFWGHFDGTSVLPTLSTPPTDAELAAKAQWEKDERSSKSLLTQKLPDSTLVLIHSKATVKGRWDAVVVVVLDMGNPWVFFTLSLPVSVCTRTHVSWVRVHAGFPLGTGKGT